MNNNKVWVMWRDSSTGSINNDMLYAKVINLDDNADVDDLCRAFVAQRAKLGVDHATVSVLENGEKLSEGKKLNDYFVPPAGAGCAFLPAPGKSRDMALELMLPQPQLQQQNESPLDLRLFKLVFDNIPTGSSGKPHIQNNLEDFDMKELKTLQMKESDKPLYRHHHQVESEEEGTVHYSREIQLQNYLDDVVKDVIRSCQCNLKTDTEASLNGLHSDIGMLRKSDDAVCGTMEVKQPKRKNNRTDPEPMKHPKVVTQVLSQMIPLRTIYGVENVYGILSTYSSWRFFRWVPEDEDLDGVEETGQLLSGVHVSESPKKTTEGDDAFLTPRKGQSESDATPVRTSPPMSPKPYCDNEDEKDEEGEDDGGDTVSRGILYASEVISDGQVALKMLAWVLGEMEQSPINLVPAHIREYLYVVQMDAVGGYEKLKHGPEFYKSRMPNVNCKRLYVLEELGHRHHGRVYRAMSKNGNLCVLKYFVKSQSIPTDKGPAREVNAAVAASMSADYWNKVYKEWLPAARYGPWGGGDAIIMPDLEKMSVLVNHYAVLPLLKESMKTRFFDLGLWHDDAAWRNVALVRTGAEGELSKVCMIDLEPARMIEKTKASVWNFDIMWEEFESKLLEDWDDFKAEDEEIV